MKKLAMTMTVMVFLLLGMMLPAYARVLDGRVIDDAGVLTAEECRELDVRAEEITEAYQCDTMIITLPELYGMEPWECAETLHQEYELGYGKERSCIMLLLATDEREFNIMAYGDGNTAFTDHGKAEMEERFLPSLSADDYYGAFTIYLDTCEEFLSMAKEGEAFDVNTDSAYVSSERRTMARIGIPVGLIFSVIMALSICTAFKKDMKTARLQESAHAYVSPNGLVLTEKEDRFLRITQTRQRIQSKSSGGGRGGTSVNRRGFSHRSGRY